MFCRNCQTIIPDDSIFCENCGAPTGRVPDEIKEDQLIPEEAVEFEVDEEPVTATSVPVDPVWWEPSEDMEVPREPDFWDDEYEPDEADHKPAEGEDESSEEMASEEEAGREEPLDGEDREVGEELEDLEEPPASEQETKESKSDDEEAEEDSNRLDLQKLTEMAAAAAAQAKPYARKAKGMLENLGKSVRTGTGWAADAAKEQFHQMKEEREEKKEQREEQREEERRRREEEERQQEEERQRLEKERRIREEERREQEERERREDLLQEPGFWYRGEIPVTEEADQSSRAEKEPDVETGTEPEAEAEGEPETETEPEAEAETEPPVEAESEPAAEPEKEPEDKAGIGFVPETQVRQEPEVETPSEENIEDKLADTARYDWTRHDLEEAAAGQDETGSGEDSDVTESPAQAGEEETAAGQDDPAIYRIKDFEAQRDKKAPFQMDRRRWTILAVIAALVVAIAIVAAVMVHQAHERQLEEEAYQASVKQADQLVVDQKYEDAEALYLKLMDQRPEDTQLYLGLAQMYMDQQRYVDAKALIKRAEEATGDTESFAQMKKDIKVLTSKKWKKQYIKVLEEFEYDIKKYEDDVQASVAVCDVNGDMKPELFFFTKEYYGYGKLHIYTTVDNKAKEVNYECKNRGTQYHDAFYDVSSDDSSYAIFNNKEDGQFSIYANIIHGNDSWDTTNEYKLNLKGGCKRVNLIEGSIDTTYREGEEDDSEYLQNEEDISYDKYIEEFKKVLEGAQQVILYNGDGGDQSVWTKVKPDSVMCMPYDSLMVDLKAK